MKRRDHGAEWEPHRPRRQSARDALLGDLALLAFGLAILGSLLVEACRR